MEKVGVLLLAMTLSIFVVRGGDRRPIPSKMVVSPKIFFRGHF